MRARFLVHAGAGFGALALLTACDVTALVSVNSDEVQADDFSRSFNAVTSADGRSIAFTSTASNLAPGDTNDVVDVFVRDLVATTTERVSVATGGGQGDGASEGTAISVDGRHAVFTSEATNLVAGDTNGVQDVFVHDRENGETSRVSIGDGGTQASAESVKGDISGDGRFVAFQSLADNLVQGDTNREWDVFVQDRTTGDTTRVSVASNRKQGDRSSFNPAMSADGRFVAFDSLATNLVPRDTNSVSDVFVHDRVTGKTTRVSVSSGGDQATSQSSLPSISSDGRSVAFYSHAPNLVPGDTNGQHDAFVHDLATDETTRVSVATDGAQATPATGSVGAPGISADGRYVTFPANASNLVANDTNNTGDVFLHDRATGRTTRISVATDGTQGNGHSSVTQRAISAGGRKIAFTSMASNLSPDDHSPPSSILTDVFARLLDDQD